MYLIQAVSNWRYGYSILCRRVGVLELEIARRVLAGKYAIVLQLEDPGIDLAQWSGPLN